MKKIINYLSIFLIGGIFGFIYETIFYRIDLGYFVKRGTTFGPWIPIYGFGALLVYFLTKKYRNNYFLVFIISLLACGILEYLTGYYLDVYKGIRLWDYNKEIWNFGNINGYICLRSVLFFGLSGLILNYIIIPIINKFDGKYFNIIIASLNSLFIIDILFNFIKSVL